MKIAVFPGQGSQHIGMGKDLYDKYPFVKLYFEEAEDISKINLKKIIFEGNEDDLKSTKISQIAIMLVSISILKAYEDISEKKLEELVSVVAGHSLGEYTALIAAEALSFQDGVRLLKARGESMENSFPKGQGGMSAIIGIKDQSVIDEMINQVNQKDIRCFVANDNCQGQLVISGHKQALIKAMNLAKSEYGAKIVKELDVSGPFHTPLMQQAQQGLKLALDQIKTITTPKIPLISNVTAKVIDCAKLIKPLLLEQVVSPVRWRESMINAINNHDVDSLVEIGPSKVLTGLIKRIDSKVLSFNLEAYNDIISFISNK